jgi:hypothetical protein
MRHKGMPASSFRTVESIGRTLPDVQVTTTWGQPALKVRGKMFVCLASHKSAEPNTLVVMMDFADRDALVEDDPGLLLEGTLPELPVCARPAFACPRRRPAGPRRRRVPLREGQDREEVGRRASPSGGPAARRALKLRGLHAR